MNGRIARAARVYFSIAGISALVVVAWQFSTPSDPESRYALGLSASRLAMTGAFILAASLAFALAGYSLRVPEKVAGRIQSHLSVDGWLRIVVFFTSASAFLVGVGVVCFRDWAPVPPGLILRLQPAVVWVMIVSVLNMLCVTGLRRADDPRQLSQTFQTDPPDPSTSFLRDLIVGCLVVLLCASALLPVNLLVGVLVKDQMESGYRQSRAALNMDRALQAGTG